MTGSGGGGGGSTGFSSTTLTGVTTSTFGVGQQVVTVTTRLNTTGAGAGHETTGHGAGHEMTGRGAGHEMTGAGAGHEMTGHGAGHAIGAGHDGHGFIGKQHLSLNLCLANALEPDPATDIKSNASAIKTGYLVLLVIT